MGGRLLRLWTSACLVCAPAAMAAADGPATAAAPATDWGDLVLVSVLGDPAFRHDGEVTKGVILSDGRRMVTSGNDGTARLWDLQTGKQLQCYRHTGDYVWDFLVLPGEEKLMTAGAEAKVVLWDLKSAQRLGEYPHGKMTFRLALDANAARLAAGDQAGYCIVWDVAGKTELDRFGPGDGKCIYTVLFSRDGNSVLTGSEDSTIRSWALDSNQERFLKPKDRDLNDRNQKIAEMLGGIADTGDIHTLAASPDGSRILVCCSKRGPWLMDANTGRELWKAKDLPSAYCAAWSPDGGGIAVSAEKQLWVLDPNTGAKLWKADLAGGTHYGIAWSPDGNLVLCGSEHLLCRFAALGASAGQRVYPPEGAPLQQDAVSGACPSPDGALLYECGSTSGLRVWDRARKTLKEAWLEKEEVRGLALSDDGLTLAAGTGNTVVTIDTRTGKEIHRYPRQSSYGGFLLTPDGNMIVLTAEGGLAVHRVATGEKVIDLSGDSRNYYSTTGFAISRDMELAVANGTQVLVFKLPGGELLQEIGGRARRGAGPGRLGPGPVVIDDIEGSSSGEQNERFSGCEFVPGAARNLITWSDKRLQLWTAGPAEANALSEAEVAELIEQLNSNSFRQREEATKRLAGGGRAILPLLRAAQPKDEEPKSRLAIVQKEILAAGKLTPGGALDLKKEGGSPSFALHPDGRHWALAHGSPPHRELMIGEISGADLRSLRTLQPTSAPNTVAFDAKGNLIVGNCNGTISEYKLQLPAQPAKAPATAPGKEGEK